MSATNPNKTKGFCVVADFTPQFSPTARKKIASPELRRDQAVPLEIAVQTFKKVSVPSSFTSCLSRHCPRYLHIFGPIV